MNLRSRRAFLAGAGVVAAAAVAGCSSALGSPVAENGGDNETAEAGTGDDAPTTTDQAETPGNTTEEPPIDAASHSDEEIDPIDDEHDADVGRGPAFFADMRSVDPESIHSWQIDLPDGLGERALIWVDIFHRGIANPDSDWAATDLALQLVVTDLDAATGVWSPQYLMRRHESRTFQFVHEPGGDISGNSLQIDMHNKLDEKARSVGIIVNAEPF